MSKKDKIDRHPVPEDVCRAFMGTMWTLVKAFGVDKIPGACHYLKLAGEEIDRYQFEQKSPAVTHQKEDTERRKFIAIFRTRFLELTDFEYNKAITPVEAKMVSQLCENLNERGFVVDEYLKWIFEDFLPTNEKFCPPQVRWSCSEFVVHKFLYENRDLMKQRKEQSVRSKQSIDLINRARVCMRQTKPEEVEKIKILIKDFYEGRIMMDEMRNKIETYEETQKKENGQTNRQTEVVNG